MIRPTALLAAIAVSLLAVSGAGGTSAQTPKRGGTVVVAFNARNEPSCLSWLPICNGGVWPYPGPSEWLNLVLARPFVSGPYGLRPDLIERYELTKNPFTVTFHIRPQARWSDGVRISAGDFRFAYRTFLEHGDIPGDFRTVIRRVQAVDAETVRFEFRAPYGDWPSVLNFPPLPRHALLGLDLGGESLWRDRIDNPKTGEPIGSGPFLVGSWERGKQLTLIRNSHYWGLHAAYVERVVLRFVSPLDTVEALASGAFDLGAVLPPSPELSGDPRFRLLNAQVSGGLEHFEVRVRTGGHPALRNKLVRRALADGVDRIALVRALFGDSAPPVLDNTTYLSSQRSYEPNWKRYRYQPAVARRLLEQAGCTRGADGIYSCAGERLQLDFVTTAGVPFRARVLEAVAVQLRRAGVEVRAVYGTQSAFFGTILPSGNFDVALFAWGKSMPQQVLDVYGCGGQSYGGYCSRLVDGDLDQLDRIVDPARRVAVANRMDRRLVTDVPTLPLFERPSTYVVRTRLHGVVPNAYGDQPSVWNAENWWLDR